MAVASREGRTRNVKAAVIAMLAFALEGCAWSDSEKPERGTLQFEKGMTSESEVIGRLGQPNETSWLPDGTVVDVYTFAPIGASAASGQSPSRELTVTFDSKGKLLSYSNTTG